METAEAEARRVASQLYHECQRAHSIYFQARKKAIAEAVKPLEHLRIASEEAITAYKAASIGLMRYPIPTTFGGARGN